MELCSACAAAYGLKREEIEVIGEKSVVSESGESSTIPLSDSPSCVGEGGGADDCSEPPIKQPKVDSTSSPTHLAGPCQACLGILEEPFITRLSDSIADEYLREGYEGVETFCLAFSTPLSLLVRKKAIDLWHQRLRAAVSPTPDPAHAPSPPHSGYVKEELRHRLRLCLVGRLSPPLTYDTHSPFQITIKIDHLNSKSECEAVIGFGSAHCSTHPLMTDSKPNKSLGRSRRRQVEINIGSVTAALDAATAEEVESLDSLVASGPTPCCSYEIIFVHKPLFIAGRYNKYSRSLPQTPWLVEGVRKCESSVQELIQGKILEVVGSSELKFSSSGREDVDVRMLGNGRPFLLELLHPKRVGLSDRDLADIQSAINCSTDLVAVRQLQVVDKEAANLLKEGEERKTKLYSATVWSSQEITPDSLSFLADIRDLWIHQKTPIRVLHRRSLATRERLIHSLQAQWLDSRHFSLQLCTQAGTYIKEFVHGDFGRTHPSLGDLMGHEVDILTLDVEEVALEWPPATPTKPQ